MASGGSRPGSGRKPIPHRDKRVQTSVSVTQETKSKMRSLAKDHNIRMGVVIDQVVEELYSKYNEKI